jgi:hypothetical protein
MVGHWSYAAAAASQGSAPSSTLPIIASAKSSSISALSSPDTRIPLEYQQKLRDKEEKLQQYQSLEDKLNHAEHMLSTLMSLPQNASFTRTPMALIGPQVPPPQPTASQEALWT